DDLFGTGRLDQLGDDLVRLVGVTCPVDNASAGGEVLLELLQPIFEVGHGRVLDCAAGVAQFFPVRKFAHYVQALVANGVGGVAQVLAHLGVAQYAVRRLGEGLGLEQVALSAGWHAEEYLSHSDTVSSMVLARMSARCKVFGLAPVRESPPPMCIRHEASPPAQAEAPVEQMFFIL